MPNEKLNELLRAPFICGAMLPAARDIDAAHELLEAFGQ